MTPPCRSFSFPPLFEDDKNENFELFDEEEDDEVGGSFDFELTIDEGFVRINPASDLAGLYPTGVAKIEVGPSEEGAIEGA